MNKIAFIGVGIMGKSMVRNLMKAGYSLTIYSRTKSKCEDVIAEGAFWADTVAGCVRDAKAVFSIVGYPRDVEEVYFGGGGIIASARPGALIVDMTTSSPALAGRIWEAGKARGLRPLDAPVTGGDTGAKAGTLSILVGGDRADTHEQDHQKERHDIAKAEDVFENYAGIRFRPVDGLDVDEVLLRPLRDLLGSKPDADIGRKSLRILMTAAPLFFLVAGLQ